MEKMNATQTTNVNQFNGALLLEILTAIATYGPSVITLIRQIVAAFQAGKTPVVLTENQDKPA